MATPQRAAVFLDRDGVLVAERGLAVDPDALHVVPGVPESLRRLAAGGFDLVVVTNQAVVARGLLTEEQVAGMHRALAQRLHAQGGPLLDAFYVCPHHPSADVERYRVACGCRKPRPGLLIRAAQERGINMARSFMVGDRITDVDAGVRAGCRTVLVRTGAHAEALIETPDPPDPELRPDHECDGVPAAATWILASGAAS